MSKALPWAPAAVASCLALLRGLGAGLQGGRYRGQGKRHILSGEFSILMKGCNESVRKEMRSLIKARNLWFQLA